MYGRVSCVSSKCEKWSALLAILLAVLLIGSSFESAEASGGHGGGHVSARSAAMGGARSRTTYRARTIVRNQPRFSSSASHFGVQHRKIGWDRGHWRHERRRGLLGWWWVVGSDAYFYPEPTIGPPSYVSETEIPIEDEQEIEPTRPTFKFLQQERQGAIYYGPGDNAGVKYRDGTECAGAQRRAGDLGICLVK